MLCIALLLVFPIGLLNFSGGNKIENDIDTNSIDISGMKSENNKLLENSIIRKLNQNYFRKNFGQFDPKTKYFIQINQVENIQFRHSSLVFQTQKGEFSISFLSSNFVEPAGYGKTEHYENYFVGSKKITRVHQFKEIYYYDLYDGIDLKYYWNGDKLKYEYLVDPFADPSQIRMKYDNIDDIKIEKDRLEITKSGFNLIDKNLKVYFSDTKSKIDASFSASNLNSHEATISFQTNKYDKSQSITIDPYMLSFSTFIGGNAFDDPYYMDVDEDGFIYVIGFAAEYVGDDEFPTTDGVFKTSRRGRDVILFKLTPDGSELLFSTYIGGGTRDTGTGIIVDEDKNIYFTGYTTANDFPTTTNAYNSTFSGGRDAFLSKLSPDGSELLYSTYLGGSDRDEPWGIVLDKENNPVIAGMTSSLDFPVTDNSTMAGEDQHNFGDVFVTKLSSDGSNLIFSIYIGGTKDDVATSIALDGLDNIIIAGGTFSSDFPVTDGTFDTTYNGDASNYQVRNVVYYGGDAFIMKLNQSGGIIFSTYIGGGGYDWALTVKNDQDNFIYIGGNTESTNFPTKNAYQSSFSGATPRALLDWDDGFILKINPNGTDLIFSSYLGGSGGETVVDLSLGNDNKIYVTGGTASEDYPITSDANFPEYGGATDIFVSKLSSDGSSLEYSTFVGGSATEWANSLKVYKDKTIYVAGTSDTFKFPTTCDVVGPTRSGNKDFVVFKLEVSESMDNSRICADITTTTEPSEGFVSFGNLFDLLGSVILGLLVIKLKQRKIRSHI